MRTTDGRGRSTRTSVYADRPFRIRFEVESGREPAVSSSIPTQRSRLDGRRSARLPKPDSNDPKTPRVSIVSCAAYKNGAATTNLLAGSAAAFQAGTGISLAGRTLPWTGGASHGEFEWSLVVRRFADGAETNEEGDAFELRMVAAGEAPAGTSRNPVLRLTIPLRHVGGTFVETPGRIGPFRAANGDLYFIMEPAETSNLFMMRVVDPR
jgi:hypothetical protein